MPHLSIGTLLNKNCYRIKQVIGQGGFGITYLADEIGFYRNTGFGDTQYVKAANPEQVVIKELYYAEYCIRDNETNRVVVTNKDRKDEFYKLVQNQLDEGKKLRMLNHANVVNTRDIFRENDTAYMVMEYIESDDLDVLLERQGKIAKELSVKYISEILSALTHIHERNQLHLDIKPSNILIRRMNNEAVLIDFGASQSYDNAGEIVGRTSQLVSAMTKHYAPNEQADIDNLKHFDATFDTYAVGATLYHLLTGQKPPMSSLLSTGRETLIPPSKIIGESAGDYLDTLISKALAPLYHKRYKTAEQFLTDIKKEKEYQTFVEDVKRLIEKKEFGKAQKELTDRQDYFCETNSLNELKTTLINEEKKSADEKKFYEYYKQGIDWLNKNDYHLALALLEKASDIYPERDDVAAQISLCKTKIIEKKIDDETRQSNRNAPKEKNEDKTVLIPSAPKEKDNEKTILIPSAPKKVDEDKTVLIPKPHADKTVIVSSSAKVKKNDEKQREKATKNNEKSGQFTLGKKRIQYFLLSFIAVVTIITAAVLFGKKSDKPVEPTPLVQKDTSLLPETATSLAEKTIETVSAEKKIDAAPTKNETPKVREDSKQTEPKTASEITKSEKQEQPATDKSVTFKGKKYVGASSGGVPNGSGTLYYTKHELISENDPNKTMAESGDYVKGKWNRGELEFGSLYNADGTKKATIIIGRY